MRRILMTVRLRLLAVPFAAAALTVGCGQGSALQSPTGPSGTAGSISFLTAEDAPVTAALSADVTTRSKYMNHSDVFGRMQAIQSNSPRARR